MGLTYRLRREGENTGAQRVVPPPEPPEPEPPEPEEPRRDPPRVAHADTPPENREPSPAPPGPRPEEPKPEKPPVADDPMPPIRPVTHSPRSTPAPRPLVTPRHTPQPQSTPLVEEAAPLPHASPLRPRPDTENMRHPISSPYQNLDAPPVVSRAEPAGLPDSPYQPAAMHEPAASVVRGDGRILYSLPALAAGMACMLAGGVYIGRDQLQALSWTGALLRELGVSPGTVIPDSITGGVLFTAGLITLLASRLRTPVFPVRWNRPHAMLSFMLMDSLSWAIAFFAGSAAVVTLVIYAGLSPWLCAPFVGLPVLVGLRMICTGCFRLWHRRSVRRSALSQS